jgi:hypothetical protein
MKIRGIIPVGLTIIYLSVCGCGDSGSDSNAVNRNSLPLAAGTHLMAFTAISTSRLPVPISGIEVAIKLPAGVSVATASGGSGALKGTALLSGSTGSVQSLAFGSYSASTRTVYLAMATIQENCRGGNMLNLLIDIDSGISITPDEIYALNAVYPRYRVVGLDTVTHNTVQLTDTVKTLFEVR